MVGSSVLLEARPFRPFKSDEEYLVAMKEDLAEWLQTLYPHLSIIADNFMEKLETGVTLCEHANAVKQQAFEYVERKQAKKPMTRTANESMAQANTILQFPDVKYFCTAKPGTFFARDNVSNFIKWCRWSLEIIECLLFESDDLIMRKNEKHVILCLLEVARRGANFGMLAPMLVQMERQIDREIALDQRKHDSSTMTAEDSDSDIDEDHKVPVMMYGPVPQIVTNDLKSLDEMVRDLVEKCNCPVQFPMIRVSEGKYRIGDTKVLIFVRILRSHVMVRVGGGWDTLSHYLDKHDPCRCRTQHRTSQSARLVSKPGSADLHGSQVYYERGVMAPSIPTHLAPPNRARSRSRSPPASLARRPASPMLTRARTATPVNRTAETRSRSPTPHSVTVVLPSATKSNTKGTTGADATLTDQSDTTSEMSDEGYRSLGVIGQEKLRKRQFLQSHHSGDEEGTEDQGDGCLSVVDDLNDIGLRKTSFSQKMYNDHMTPLVKPTTPTPRCKTASPTVMVSGQSKTNTWNGRAKGTRPNLTPETFQRNIGTRRSTICYGSGGANGGRSTASAATTNGGSLSANTSPTKGRLRQELLSAVKCGGNDDATIMHQVELLLNRYKSLQLIPPTQGHDAQSSTSFRRQDGVRRASFRTPRKDTSTIITKTETSPSAHHHHHHHPLISTRIPAPVAVPKV